MIEYKTCTIEYNTCTIEYKTCCGGRLLPHGGSQNRNQYQRKTKQKKRRCLAKLASEGDATRPGYEPDGQAMSQTARLYGHKKKKGSVEKAMSLTERL